MADISKRIQARLNWKKKELAFMDALVKTPAHLTGADISKRIQAKLNVKKKILALMGKFVRPTRPTPSFKVCGLRRNF